MKFLMKIYLLYSFYIGISADKFSNDINYIFSNSSLPCSLFSVLSKISFSVVFPIPAIIIINHLVSNIRNMITYIP